MLNITWDVAYNVDGETSKHKEVYNKAVTQYTGTILSKYIYSKLIIQIIWLDIGNFLISISILFILVCKHNFFFVRKGEINPSKVAKSMWCKVKLKYS